MPGQVPPLTDERDLLLAYVAQQRDGIRYAAYGLTDEQARMTPTVSSLSLGGLIKHVTGTERTWIDLAVQRPSDRSRNDQEVGYGDAFRLGPDETLAGVLARYADVAEETAAALATVTLDQPVPVPKGVPWFPADVENWTVRWVLLHLVEETARHAGHADIIREAIDGATMYELMAAAEGWPATEWLKPWEPRA
jgi:Protein of unknown function (DUF664)